MVPLHKGKEILLTFSSFVFYLNGTVLLFTLYISNTVSQCSSGSYMVLNFNILG